MKKTSEVDFNVKRKLKEDVYYRDSEHHYNPFNKGGKSPVVGKVGRLRRNGTETPVLWYA